MMVHKLHNLLKSARLVVVGTALLLIAVPTTSVQALTFKAIQDSNTSKPWYNKNDTTVACGSAADPGGGTIDVTGNNVKDSYTALVADGFTAAQASGIVGNLMQESGASISPTASDGVAYGIAQWQGGRLPAMRRWVSAQPAPNNDPSGFAGQLAFLIHDLATGYSQTTTKVKATDTPSAAAQAFELSYEGAGDPQMQKRINNANDVYAKYSGDTSGDVGGDTTPDAGCVVNNGTSPDCTTAVGNAKILCAAQKYEGIYYTYAGGPHYAGAYTAFRAKCPADTAASTAASSTEADPGPCTTDCSGLVSASVDEAFSQNLGWVVESLENDTTNWRKVDSVSNAQAGDVVTVDDGDVGEHVEIVDHVVGSQVYVFGSHHTGTKTGPKTVPISYWNGGAFHYIGPGGS